MAKAGRNKAICTLLFKAARMALPDARITGQLRMPSAVLTGVRRAASRYVDLITRANERTMILWGAG
jgi:hypothetical protein